MSKLPSANVIGEINKPANLITTHRAVIISLFVTVGFSCLLLYHSAYPFEFLPTYDDLISPLIKSQASPFDSKLEKVLAKASMKDKTVIITTMNHAWAEPNSIFDLFLKSFHIGNGTRKFLDNLMVVSLDAKAHARCELIHTHCYALNTTGFDFSGTEAYFMTSNYLEMMWIRIRLLSTILEMGYNFVFTDADIMWLQDPFPHFYQDADFQIACDNFRGNPSDLHNSPNGGFNYVKTNNKTIKFYKFWYSSRLTYPGLHDQDVLNKIKFQPRISETGVTIKFLDTAYFGGFCELSRDFNLVATMHANCCFGLESKIRDLNLVLDDWQRFMQFSPSEKAENKIYWRVPKHCSLKDFHPPPSPSPPAIPKINGTEGNNQTS